MSKEVIYVERSGYNGYGDTDREGGDFFAICLVIGFALFLILI